MSRTSSILAVCLAVVLAVGCSSRPEAEKKEPAQNLRQSKLKQSAAEAARKEWEPFPGTPSRAITIMNRESDADEIFGLLSERIRQAREDRERPVVIFDLDATLFDNRPRVQRIFQDIAKNCGDTLPEREKAILNNLPLGRIYYSVENTLKNSGISHDASIDYIFKGWLKRFFTDEYVTLDVPIPGAVTFVNDVADSGAVIVYLTGRDTPNMRNGTVMDLRSHKFPVPDESKVILITKPGFDEDDLTYKQDAIKRIRKLGTVVGCFENEPRNSNLLVVSFPEALHVFLDTAHSGKVEPLLSDLLVIKHFKRSQLNL